MGRESRKQSLKKNTNASADITKERFNCNKKCVMLVLKSKKARHVMKESLCCNIDLHVFSIKRLRLGFVCYM